MPCTALAVMLQGEVVPDVVHEVGPGVEAAPGHQLRAVLPADGGGRVPVQQDITYCIVYPPRKFVDTFRALLTGPPRPPPRAWSGSSRRAAAPSRADTRP